MMLGQFWFGLILGWGAAIPIGPINLEVVRRNLRFGTLTGFIFGLGACTADLTYLILLSLGLLHTLSYPLLMKVFGAVGSLLLIWFGVSALRFKADKTSLEKFKTTARRSSWRHFTEAYVFTLVNPFTFLFWSSVSVTIAVKTQNMPHSILFAGLGVLVGTISWITSLNLFLHQTRHRLTDKVMRNLNYVGGIILLVFAAIGLGQVFLR